jgi:dinuclear metal center YbgI/SA1388 family protein
MKTSELVTYLDDYLQIARYTDRSNNGLQVQGHAEVTRVAFAVDACLASFQRAAAERAHLLIVHHGLFWSEHIQVTGGHYERIKTLVCAECGLYAAHIPLDAHPQVGNNIELARIAGLQDIEPWGAHKGTTIGFIGNLPQPTPMAELNARLQARIGAGNRMQLSTPGRHGPVLHGTRGAGSTGAGGEGEDYARRVAVCSGFGITLIDDAFAAGADTLITGETSHAWFHTVAERRLNVIFGGHYNTETVGLQALAGHLERQFGLETAFIDLPTGL